MVLSRLDARVEMRLWLMGLASTLCLILFLFGSAASALYGQTTQGAVLGSITDPAGAVVPDFAIEVTSLGTGFNRKTATDSTGFYLIDHLEPGTYSVTATAHGFKTTVRPSVTLVTNAQVRVDLRLEVAQTNEQI